MGALPSCTLGQDNVGQNTWIKKLSELVPDQIMNSVPSSGHIEKLTPLTDYGHSEGSEDKVSRMCKA